MGAPLKVGFHPPLQCVRGRTDCRSLAQIISSDEPRTFVCCGEVVDGATPDPADQWSFCFKGNQTRPHCAGTDVRFFVDQRDISHMAAVVSMGLAMAIPPAPPVIAEPKAIIAGGIPDSGDV